MTPLVLVAVLAQAGETSVSRVPVAEIGPKGLLRFGVDGSVGSSATFPEKGVSHRRTATSVRVGFAPFETWEFFGSIGGATLTGPQVLSVQGDARIGLKWKPSGKDAFWALDASMLLPSGLDGGFPVTNATSLTVRALAGTSLGTAGGLELRVDGVLGVDMDRTRRIAGDLALTPVQQYGLGIQQGGAVVGGIALSGTQGAWMPFLELSAEVPTAAATEDAPRLVAKRATAGFCWEFVKGATLDGAFDVALGKTAANAVFRTAAPWEAHAGVSIALDPLKSLGEPPPPPPPEIRTVYVEKPAPPPQVVEVPAPPQDGVLAGRLVGADGKGIPDAVVDTSAGRTVTDIDGRFEMRVLAGRVGLAIKHPAYEAATLTKEVQAGVRTNIELHLAPRVAVGSILGRIEHPEGKLSIRAFGPTQTSTTIEGPELALDGLAPGTWRLVFFGDGVLARSRTLDVVGHKTTPFEVTLAPKPATSALDTTSGLATVQPLAFEGDALAPASRPVIDEIADFLLAARADVKLSIAGIAPPNLKGAKAEAAAIARAEAVKSALVERGVPAERLLPKTAPAPKKAKPMPTVLFELVP